MREGIIARAFNANIETGPERYGSRPREILFEPREQLAEGALAAEQQRMHVPRLRRSRAVRRLRGQSVALQHNYLIEAVGECPRGREPGHTGADHDRLLANHSRRHRHLPTACSAAMYRRMASHLIKLQPQSKR